MGNVNTIGPNLDASVIQQNDSNIDADLQATKTTVNNNASALNTQQGQLNDVQTTANTANSKINDHIASTAAHPASNITETRLGNAQSALDDLNTRVNNIVGQTGSSNTEIVDARQSTPYNYTFGTLKARLDAADNNLLNAQNIVRETIPTGVVTNSTITGGVTNPLSSFTLAAFDVWVNGYKVSIPQTTITLAAPPTADGSYADGAYSQYDLVFLEFYMATEGTMSYRYRTVSNVNFGSYPEGVNAPNVYAQGALSSPSTTNFSLSSTDSGLYVANGSFSTVDGNSYAICVAKVGRRNSTAFNPDTNPTGAPLYSSGSGRNTDGLYADVIAFTGITKDIVDLRHNVSLSGFNMQALLEMNLDLLLRGQLYSLKNPQYGRDYIGLNVGSYTDDVNTLLYCKFDGSINATANGASVTGTMNSGSPSYVNGVQGESLLLPNGSNVYYSITGTGNSGTIEFCFKLSFTPGDGSSHNLVIGYAGSTIIWSLFSDGSGNMIFATYNSSGTSIGSITLGKLTSTSKNDWHCIQITWNNSTTLNGVLDGNAPTSVTMSGTIGSATTVYMYGTITQIDLLRISNIVRSGSLLPTGYSYANGDRILDGGFGDFSQWSDDLGGTSGVNGRTNPYGLTHVPNQIAGRIAYNGSEIRHYYGNGVTSGWHATSAMVSSPSGAFDDSGEYQWVQSNESANGSITTFTFNKPTNANGMLILYYGFSNMVQVNNAWVTPSSASYNPSTGVVTVTLSTAPASGQGVQLVYTTASRHAHLIQSTKGFVIHDWSDDTFSNVNGTQTVWQTNQYNVTSVNNPRITASGQSAQIFNGNYSVSGLNAATTLSAAAASGATTISVASASNFVANQKIRISKGDGTWYTTTITSISGTTITIPATTVALSQNAIVQGAALVTFTTAPASGSTVDVVYESVSTPSLGDYIRVLYQHTPYQGLYKDSDLSGTVMFVDKFMKQLSFGTGKVNTPSVNRFEVPISPSLPLPTAYTDSQLKSDALTNVSSASRNLDFILGKVLYEDNGLGTNSYQLVQEGNGLVLYGNNIAERGCSFATGCISITGTALSSSAPHVNLLSILMSDQSTGELYLVVATQWSTNTSGDITINQSNSGAIDAYKVQGRPLIKNYGGMTA